MKGGSNETTSLSDQVCNSDHNHHPISSHTQLILPTQDALQDTEAQKRPLTGCVARSSSHSSTAYKDCMLLLADTSVDTAFAASQIAFKTACAEKALFHKGVS